MQARAAYAPPSEIRLTMKTKGMRMTVRTAALCLLSMVVSMSGCALTFGYRHASALLMTVSERQIRNLEDVFRMTFAQPAQTAPAGYHEMVRELRASLTVLLLEARPGK